MNHHRFKTKYLIVFVFLLSVISCTRSGPSSSKIEIKAPTQSDFGSSSKVNAQSSNIDANLLCYAVNVTGPNLNSKTPSCDISKSIVTGSVPSGQFLSLEVPRGDGYKFELIGLLRSSTRESCPTVTLDS